MHGLRIFVSVFFCTVFVCLAHGSAPWLRDHLVETTDVELAGQIPAQSIAIFSSRNTSTGVYTRNIDLWTTLDLTGTTANNWGGVAISPRHVLYAAHASAGVGAEIHFVTEDNITIRRTITAMQTAPGYSPYWPDWRIALLDSDLPSTITYAHFLPDNWVDYLPGNLSQNRLPSIGLNQFREATVQEVYAIASASSNPMTYTSAPTDPQRLAFFRTKISGDSSSPLLFSVHSQPVVLAVWTYGGSGSGTSLTTQKAAINTVMSNLGGGYQITETDLTAFTGATYETWSAHYFSPAELADPTVSSPQADPEGDGLPNLLEYALGLDPLLSDSAGAVTIGKTTDAGNERLTLTFNRIADPDLTYVVEATDDLVSGIWTPVFTSTGVENIAGSYTAEDGELIANHARRFLRLSVTTGTDTVKDAPRGAMNYLISADTQQSLGFPLLPPAVFSGRVVAGDESGTVLIEGDIDWSSLLSPGIPYYLEVTKRSDGSSSDPVGERFELDEETMLSSTNGAIIIDTTSSFNTTVTNFVVLVDCQITIRPHWTLASLFGTGVTAPHLNSSTVVSNADQVLTWTGSGWSTYWFRQNSNGTVKEWRNTATANVNQDAIAVPPGTGVWFHRQSQALDMVVLGEVRTHRFVRNLDDTTQLFALGYPVDQSPVELGFLPASGFTAGTTVASADQILTWNGSSYSTYWLRRNSTGDVIEWRNTATSTVNHSDTPFITASGSVFIKPKAILNDLHQTIPFSY